MVQEKEASSASAARSVRATTGRCASSKTSGAGDAGAAQRAASGAPAARTAGLASSLLASRADEAQTRQEKFLIQESGAAETGSGARRAASAHGAVADGPSAARAR